MKLGKALLIRLGWRTRQAPDRDAFDLRLERIGARERRCAALVGVFRNRGSRLAV